MAGPFKGTLFINTADAGWTETYYINAASLAAASTALGNILTPRQGVSRSEVKFPVGRIVDLSAPRTSLLLTVVAPAGTWAGADLSTVDPALAILVRMGSADGLTRSRHFLRGIPSLQINGAATDPITWGPTAGYTTALNAWIAAVQANAVLAKKTAPLTYTTKAITNMAISTVGTIRRAGRPFGLRRGRRLIV
jgi:hypothetical protein